MISVVIPLFNKEQIIGKSLRSVLSQDYDNFEVVVVNDGSTDRSAEIVKSIDDPRIRLIEQENGGPSKARNTGVKNAKGEWIVFLDADDEFLPGALKRFSEMKDTIKDVEIFNCSFLICDGKKRTKACFYNDGIVKSVFMEHAFGKLIPRAGTMMVSKRLMQKHPYDERLRRFEDLENLLKLYKESKVYNCSVPSMIVNWQYAAASKRRENIKEDFVGHISLEGKVFWEKMCVYKLFMEQRELYSDECKKLYPRLYNRWDLLIVYHIIGYIKKIFMNTNYVE